MSLASQVTALAQAVAADIKNLIASVGLLSALTTTSKSSLVEAINEVKASASGGGITKEVLVDFGNTSSTSKTFDVAMAEALTTHKVVATPSLNMPAGVDADELEMDMLACAGRVISNGMVRLTVASSSGPVRGQRNINVSLG